MDSAESWIPESALAEASPEELSRRLDEASTTAMPLFALLGRAGTLEILYEVGRRNTVRFTELKEVLEISSATLSARLSELVDAGFVTRTAYDENPPRVEYAKTAKLADLKPVFYGLLAWADRHGFETANGADGTDSTNATDPTDPTDPAG